MNTSSKYILFQEHNYGIFTCQLCEKKLIPTTLESCGCGTIEKITYVDDRYKTARKCKNKEHLLYSIAYNGIDPCGEHAFVCSEACANMFMLSKL